MARLKLTLVLDSGARIGPGKAALLERVRDTGSISAAARAMGMDYKLAGSLSLAVSLPTMLVGFARYSRDRSFAVLGRHRGFALAMAAGSVAGAFVGGRLLGVVPGSVLLPTLAAVLVISAVKVWGQARAPSGRGISGANRRRTGPADLGGIDA